ncbi:MAG: NUDIX hydrolase [Gammaproteobacteria bacterium]|nr:NUDIX hydrolase [Gammaproteobacteria bacterium]MBS04774.1 NUDIX hydrolase [Gammaproteobacteria bacterium]|tara:strand:+ start:502 stop:1071 length:570 start_codon:yes stop_codon:yes gene_type:complete
MVDVKPWRRVDTRQLTDCRVFTVHEARSASPHDAREHNFFVIESNEWVNCVPLTANNEVVCIRQYRHGTDEITLEIPGGLVDDGEDPAVSSARECLEETGYAAHEVSSLGVLTPNPALFVNRLHTFVAFDVERVSDVANTATEHTDVQLIPLDQIPDLLLSGEIDHALVAATLWRLLYFLRTDPDFLRA